MESDAKFQTEVNESKDEIFFPIPNSRILWIMIRYRYEFGTYSRALGNHGQSYVLDTAHWQPQGMNTMQAGKG